MRLKNTILSLVLIVGMVLGNGAFLGNANPAAAYLPVAAPAAREVQAVAATFPVIADFEGGVPDGWFVYGDWDNETYTITVDIDVMTVEDSDALVLPGQIGNNDVLSVTADVATWAGFGAGLTPAQDWSDYDAISLWYYGTNLDTTHEFEIQTANAGNRRATFIDDFEGWRQIILPFSTFGDDGAYDVSQVTNWVFILDGTIGSFKLDHLELVNLAPFADFEGGVPEGWFQYEGGGASPPIVEVINFPDNDPLALPGQIGANDVLSVTANAAVGWAGFGAALLVDWSDMHGVSFWYYGTNLNTTHEFEIQTANNGNHRAEFVDDFVGWRHIALPFSVFGDGSADVSQITNWVFVLDGTVGSFMIDDIGVYGDIADRQPKVDFDRPVYIVSEDVGEAVITVTLDIASSVPVTVSYETLDDEGTATPYVDYEPVSGVLVFEPGVTELTFTVPITEDDVYQPTQLVWLALSDPLAEGTFTLLLGGVNNPAQLLILDNDPPPDSLLIDDFESGLPYGYDAFNNSLGFGVWGSSGADTPVLDTTTIITPVPGFPVTNTVLSAVYNISQWGGFTHAFGDNDEWVSQDWSAYDGLRFWLYGNDTGGQIQVEIFDNQAISSTHDSAERFYTHITDDYTGWQQFHLPFSTFQRRTDWQPSGAPNDGFNLTEVSGYAFGLPAGTGEQTLYLDQVEIYGQREPGDMPLRVQFSAYAYAAPEGTTASVRVVLNRADELTATVDYEITEGTAEAGHDYEAPASGTLTFAPGETVQTIEIVILEDRKIEGDERFSITLSNPTNAALGWKTTAPFVIRDVPLPGMLDDFERGIPVGLEAFGGITVTLEEILDTSPLALPGQDLLNTVLSVTYDLPAQAIQAVQQSGGGFIRNFNVSRDWSAYDAFDFWFYGMNTGTTMTVQILDNKAPDPGPEGWVLVWGDEFEGEAGAEPDQTKWGYDIGGEGWGNAERQYYTDKRENSALDGNGNLVITATHSTNLDYECNYTSEGVPGTCEYTSARLLTEDKFDFMYGRVEASIKIPYGQGIWPAFWMLGNDFSDIGWPDCGEIDIMENIGLEEELNTVHGTVHGPGYSGAHGIGGSYVHTEPLSSNYHVYAIEWEPDEIRWYLDDTQYFTLTHDMLPDGAPWVFDHPFFLIMNIAVGGHWPGYPDDTTTFPQTMHIEYVRVYQAPAEPERFETTFVDDFTGWQRINMPFSNFVRSADQPEGVPDDGLTLTEMWGYGFNIPAGTQGAFYLDEIRVMERMNIYLPLVLRSSQ